MSDLLVIDGDASMAPWHSESAARLSALQELGDNWNGYGEKPITDEAVRRAWEVLRDLADTVPKPLIAPLTNGGIGIEWDDNDPAVFVDVDSRGAVSAAWIKQHNGEELEIEDFETPEWKRIRSFLCARDGDMR